MIYHQVFKNEHHAYNKLEQKVQCSVLRGDKLCLCQKQLQCGCTKDMTMKDTPHALWFFSGFYFDIWYWMIVLALLVQPGPLWNDSMYKEIAYCFSCRMSLLMKCVVPISCLLIHMVSQSFIDLVLLSIASLVSMFVDNLL